MPYKEYLYFKGIIDYILNNKNVQNLAYNVCKTIHKIEMNTTHNNILLIEQSQKICEQIRDLLLIRNYKIDTVYNIQEAYHLMRKNHYDLIILDVFYEEHYHLMNKIKDEIDKLLPIVVLTENHRSYETVRDAYKNGASECLRKPIFAEEFILKIDQLTEQTRLLSEITDKKKLIDDYQLIVDNTTILSKTDPNGIITYVNDKFCEVSGYSADELLGQSHRIIRHPDMPQELFEDMWQTIKGEKKLWSGIVKNRKKDGSTYTVQSFIMPILKRNKTISEFIALRTLIPPYILEQKGA